MIRSCSARSPQSRLETPASDHPKAAKPLIKDLGGGALTALPLTGACADLVIYVESGG
jgi:hypothetical protein